VGGELQAYSRNISDGERGGAKAFFGFTFFW